MPTYEYRCTRCKHEFEQFQSMKDKPLKTCPACKKASLERLIGVGAAVIFKGSGFYQTDYRSEAYRKAAQADSFSGPSKESTDKPAGGDAGDSKKPDASAKAPGDTKTGNDKASDKNTGSDKSSGPNKNSGSDKSASSSSEKPSESSKSDSSRRSVAINSRSSATTKSSSKSSAKPTAKKSASKAKATKR